MALLDDVIEATGGIERWNGLKRFTLQLSIDGELFSKVGPASRFKDIVAEGSTQSQSVRFSGFADPGKFGVYEPDYVTIESPEGNDTARLAQPQPDVSGSSPGNASGRIVSRFLLRLFRLELYDDAVSLTHPDVKVEELPTWQERDQPWRRLRAVFPPNIVTHSREQTFYFDEAGLQRRTDHDLLGTHVAHYSWAHQDFCGIVVPTLRRSLTLQPTEP